MIFQDRIHAGRPLANKLQRFRKGNLNLVPEMKGLIVFAHGSGSSRKSPRNKLAAQALNSAGFATLLFDLLTEEEAKNHKIVFNIEFLGQRLISAVQWLRQQGRFAKIPIGFFGASTGAAAALQAAARLSQDENIFAIVSRGGRPDLAGAALTLVKIPTLMVVGSLDESVVELNQYAERQLLNSKIVIIPGASHFFDEPGTLEEASKQEP